MAVDDLAKRRLEKSPHLSGPARCMACKHEWDAVSPVGVFDFLECPSCGAAKGVRTTLVVPDEVFRCTCGSDLYYLSPKGARCCNCGVMAEGWC